ncbi:MAG: lamin tail domain-containing protein [Saprospiraceae bacterium]|nr:lamin tail domain-containing protein [Saprospiraceae bacterium]
MKNLLTLITFICIFASMSYAQIVVTEISYNPPEGGTDSLEYIEIYNSGVSAVNMNNYKFTKGVSFTFPDTSSAPASIY